MTQPGTGLTPIFSVGLPDAARESRRPARDERQSSGGRGLHLKNAVSAFAVSALAMVFSVQQGEHGPLVVYKLEVPRTSAPQNPPAAQAPKAAAAAQPESDLPRTPKLSPLEPTILGTVVLPAERAAAILQPAEPLPNTEAGPLPLGVPSAESVYRIVSDYESSDEAMINVETGTALTLQEVNDAILWRRDTAEKLRRVPVGPRF